MLDSQSIRTSHGGQTIGDDVGKRVRGRKRHLLVDANSPLLRVVVHSASAQERAGAEWVLTGIHCTFPQRGLIWVDGGHVNHIDASLIG